MTNGLILPNWCSGSACYYICCGALRRKEFALYNIREIHSSRREIEEKRLRKFNNSRE
jgi:hypothetical protein